MSTHGQRWHRTWLTTPHSSLLLHNHTYAWLKVMPLLIRWSYKSFMSAVTCLPDLRISDNRAQQFSLTALRGQTPAILGKWFVMHLDYITLLSRTQHSLGCQLLETCLEQYLRLSVTWVLTEEICAWRRYPSWRYYVLTSAGCLVNNHRVPFGKAGTKNVLPLSHKDVLN